MRTSTAVAIREFVPIPARLSLLHNKRTIPHAGRRIEVFVNRIAQLFNSMDPSPFHEKDLDPQAEEYIVTRLQEFAPHEHVSLIVHVKLNPKHQELQHLVETAVHNHFLYRAHRKRSELDRLLREGRTFLVIGLTFLATCLIASELLLLQDQSGTIVKLVRESLTIAGWVAMWHPMKIFLYDWWPVREIGRVYKKLSRMHVEVRIGNTTG